MFIALGKYNTHTQGGGIAGLVTNITGGTILKQLLVSFLITPSLVYTMLRIYVVGRPKFFGTYMFHSFCYWNQITSVKLKIIKFNNLLNE